MKKKELRKIKLPWIFFLPLYPLFILSAVIEGMIAMWVTFWELTLKGAVSK